MVIDSKAFRFEILLMKFDSMKNIFGIISHGGKSSRKIRKSVLHAVLTFTIITD